MGSRRHVFLVAGLLLAVAGNSAVAQKRGGVLKMYFFDSPASMSIHEEATIAGQGPMMGVFNNLVMYKQDVPQASIESIVPDLGASGLGARTAKSSPSNCAKASNGTTANRSRRRT